MAPCPSPALPPFVTAVPLVLDPHGSSLASSAESRGHVHVSSVAVRQEQLPQKISDGNGKKKAVQGRSPNPPGESDPKGPALSRRRKERDPSRSREKILSLVEAIQEEYVEELEIVDARDLMATDVSKWGRIVDRVNAATRG